MFFDAFSVFEFVVIEAFEIGCAASGSAFADADGIFNGCGACDGRFSEGAIDTSLNFVIFADGGAGGGCVFACVLGVDGIRVTNLTGSACYGFCIFEFAVESAAVKGCFGDAEERFVFDIVSVDVFTAVIASYSADACGAGVIGHIAFRA